MAKFFLSLSSVTNLLKGGSPGSYTENAVKKAREIIEDHAKDIALTAREIANNAGHVRVSDEEIKMAAKYLYR